MVCNTVYLFYLNIDILYNYVKIYNEANEWCKYCHKQAQ